MKKTLNNMDLDTDSEKEVLCEKIINDIHAVFVKDADLSSFEIIPTILNRNKSPVIHAEHHLGLESWCAKHVYDHAHKTIIAHRRQHHQRFLQNSNDILLVKYLNVALLINPDVSSFWNIRRQLVQINRLKINREFQFSSLILTKKPKSNEAFAYRRWLFSFQSAESIDWPYEIGLCDRCADRSSSNYHAWSHRQWVLQNAPFLIKSELILSEKFMRKHISDYSSYHYRQKVIARAYELCFSDPDDLRHLQSLRDLISFYLITEINSVEDMLQTLIPGIDQVAVGEPRLKSFLYCCNLAAHDIHLCNDMKNMYGERESFELHRRASLRFIVEHCVRLMQGETVGIYFRPPTLAQAQEFNAQLHKFDFSTSKFLNALKRSESLHGEQHRKWCALYLGFNFENGAVA